MERTVYHVDSRGFRSVTPKSSLSLTLRVTTISRCSKAVAAIKPSAAGRLVHCVISGIRPVNNGIRTFSSGSVREPRHLERRHAPGEGSRLQSRSSARPLTSAHMSAKVRFCDSFTGNAGALCSAISGSHRSTVNPRAAPALGSRRRGLQGFRRLRSWRAAPLPSHYRIPIGGTVNKCRFVEPWFASHCR